MKKASLFLMSILICGCHSSKPNQVSAPADITPHVYALRQEIADCFRSHGIPATGPKCYVSVALKEQDAGQWKGVPLFYVNGEVVGGICYGRCHGSSSIYIGRRPDGYWDRDTLWHELGHAEDFCSLCRGGHPPEYDPCLPHWPYLGSGSIRSGVVTVATTEEGWVCVTGILADGTFITAFSTENIVKVGALADGKALEWLQGVKDELEGRKDGK